MNSEPSSLFEEELEGLKTVILGGFPGPKKYLVLLSDTSGFEVKTKVQEPLLRLGRMERYLLSIDVVVEGEITEP